MRRSVAYILALLLAVMLCACGRRTNVPKQMPEATFCIEHVADTVKTAESKTIPNNTFIHVTEPKEDSTEVVAIDYLEFEEISIVEQPNLALSIECFYEPVSPAYQTPSRHVFIEFADTAIKNSVYIFYYSPRMADNSYPFQQHLGSDNNFVGLTDADRRTVVSIPDTIEPGARLLFRSVGCEPCGIYVDSIGKDGCAVMQLTPKTYTTVVALEEKDKKIVSSVVNEDPTYKAFYGDCNPIYYRDGSHADPICAFSCLAHCYPSVQGWQVQEVLSGSKEDVKLLYKALQKGDSCSLLLSVSKGKATVEVVQQPGEKVNGLMQTLVDVKWDIRSPDAAYFQQRLVFATADRLKELIW